MYSKNRTAAILVFLPAMLSLVIAMHHPVLSQADRQGGDGLVIGVGRIAITSALFHSFFLFLLAAQALGLYVFAEWLGLSRMWVRAGAMFYAIATVLMFVPGAFDGFLTPLLVARCAPSLASACLNISAAFDWAAIQALTRVALATQALGLLSWSVALGCMAGWRRSAGTVGALIAMVALAMLGSITQAINPARLEVLIVPEAIWSMAAAVMLWKSSAFGFEK